MAAHVRLKNEFTKDEKYIISWDGSNVRQKYWFGYTKDFPLQWDIRTKL